MAKKTKKAKKLKTKKGLMLQIVNIDAAGIDVSSTEMQVCVPLDRAEDYNRKFGTFTEDLNAIGDWLQSCQITTVAMESTSIYWIPLYMNLESRGIEVYLVNAKSASNFMEEKTDEVDAESLMLMHSYGLLKPSYQVDNRAREIRNLSRHRENLIQSASKEIQHMQKSMDLMNIKLGNVISDIDGKTGELIIRAILSGERNPQKLSELADPRCKSSREVIAKSLEGKWDEDLLFALKQSFELYHFIKAQIKECELKMESLFKKYICTLPEQHKTTVRSTKQKVKRRKIAFDTELLASNIFGVNLMCIPGISEGTVLKLVGELGHDFTEKFAGYKQFCRWVNLAPNNKISGGKIISSHLPNRKNTVGQILREAALSLQGSKSALGDYYRRMMARKGPQGAIVATANKVCKIIYTMVKRQEEYNEIRIQTDDPTYMMRKMKNMQKSMAKLQLQIDNYQQKSTA